MKHYLACPVLALSMVPQPISAKLGVGELSTEKDGEKARVLKEPSSSAIPGSIPLPPNYKPTRQNPDQQGKFPPLKSGPLPSKRDIYASSSDTSVQRSSCFVTGCSGTRCSDHGIFTTCNWEDYFICYHQHGNCGNYGSSGSCDWQPTSALHDCLKGYGLRCFDYPQNWYDSDGPYFDCDWYANPSYDLCNWFGNYYENFGYTAKGACCACGGGFWLPCKDSPSDWYDSDGPDFDCDWYSVGNRCAAYGDGWANFGYTANQACCACGGGKDALNYGWT